MPAQLPIQFACSGCSEAGQLANLSREPRVLPDCQRAAAAGKVLKTMERRLTRRG